MFTFKCELNKSQDGQVTGFDLGYITFLSEFGSWSSKNLFPEQSMMLFISIVELLDGLRRFLSRKQRKAYEFVGADCSFSVRFEKDASGKVSVMSGNTIISRASQEELIQAIWLGVQNFMKAEGNNLPEGDAVYEDLHAALRSFSAFSQKIQENRRAIW